MIGERRGSKTRVQAVAVDAGKRRPQPEQVTTEEPLEIRLGLAEGTRTVAVTMRTPGADFELAAGFLHSEGVISSRDEIRDVAYCVDPGLGEEQRYNIVTVTLRAGAAPDLAPLERHFFSTSACGVCGKASLEALSLRGCAPLQGGPVVEAATLTSMPERLRAAQGIFDATGGLHAAALFDAEGQLLLAREDIGRHNAIDKVVGWALMHDRLPLSQGVLLVSGRASFEVVQKALVAGVPVVCAVSAPSSLAVSLAESFGMTLVGFLRGDRFNIYAGPERVS